MTAKPKFRRGLPAMVSAGAEFAEIAALSEDRREQFCRDLLTEFGADVASVNTAKGELRHSCVLPFGRHAHGDSNPSASLSWKKLCYVCWGCGNGGGILWFIATCRGQSVDQVRDWIVNQRTLVTEDALAELLGYLDRLGTSGGPAEQIPTYSPKLLDPWRAAVRGHPYLIGRGISAPQIEAHRLGLDTGANRIVIPHFWKGDLVGWQSRRLGDQGPKYLSTPGFPKDRTVYHYRDRDWAVVVESPMSVVARDDVVPMEATFGAMVTDQQVRLLGRHPRAVLFFDNDPAGWDATDRVGEALTGLTDVRAVENPYDADPADLHPDIVWDLVEKAVPYPVWSRPQEELIPCPSSRQGRAPSPVPT